MTKKGHQNFRRIEIVDFGVKFLKKVVLKFFGQMCSDEFFLKHALLGGLLSADGNNKKHTKKNWTHVASIQNDDQDMEKQRTKKRETKIKIYETMIRPIFLYGSECWTMRKQDEKRILAAEMSWLRRIAEVTRLHKKETMTLKKP